MNRYMIGLLLLAVAGSASAQSRAPLFRASNVPVAFSTFLVGSSAFPQGVAGGTEAFLAGHITEGFDRNRNGFSGFAVVLTDNTALAPLGAAMEASFNQFYDTLLPLYMALDGPATHVASFGTPITQPLAEAIVAASKAFAGSLTGNSSLPGLSGLK